MNDHISEAVKELRRIGFRAEFSKGHAGETVINLYHIPKEYVINCIVRKGIRGFKDGFYYLVDFTKGNFIHIDIETHFAISKLILGYFPKGVMKND